MEEALFAKILDDIKESSEYIYFHVKGEPLMHPKLERFLDISHEKGFRVSLATNGTLIGKTGDMLLNKPALRQISFSLHSLEEETDRVIIEKYLDNIFSFALQAAGKTKTFIEFKLWNHNRAEDNELNKIIYEHIENRLKLDCKISGMTHTGKGIKILDRIFISKGVEFNWPGTDLPENSLNGYCYGLKRQAAILVDGTVVPCCLDGKGVMKLGNIKESSFSDIISSDRAMRIIRGFAERTAVEDLCRRCTYRDRFGV